MYNKHIVMQDINNSNTINNKSFNSFLTNSKVEEVEAGKEYNIVFNEDEGLMIGVIICDYKGFWITQNTGVDIWNDAQRQLLFCKIDEAIEEKSAKVSDYDIREEQGFFGYGY